jgi:lauroyl/myristoyl acyltransferase
VREQAVARRTLVAKEDCFFCIELPFLWLISLLLPERMWKNACYRLEQFKSAIHFFSPEAVAEIVRRVLPAFRHSEQARVFALRHAATRSEHHLQILRELTPGGWRPDLTLRGIEHLNLAIAAGHGAVLWIAHFSFNALATKKALADAGFKVWHLSRPEHGFSKSRLGIRFLNPIRVAAEMRYLGGRIIIDRADPMRARSHAERLLRENGIISITAGAWEGRRVAHPNLLGGTIEIATGAPGFSLRCNAPLLPVFTAREENGPNIAVVIEPPIVAEGADISAKLASAAQQFMDRLTPYLLAHPEQWRDWKNLRLERSQES